MEPPRVTPPSRRRLTRSTQERMWAGVAGGMAEYFDVDPAVMRLIWVAAAIFTSGFAILAYIVLWIVIPRADQVARDWRRPEWREWAEELETESREFAQEARRFAHQVADSARARAEAPASAAEGSGETGRTWRTAATVEPRPAGEATDELTLEPDRPAPSGAATARDRWEPAPEPAVPVSYPVPPAPYRVEHEHEPRGPHRQRTAGIILVALGLIFLASEMGIFRWIEWSLVWPLVLVAVGVALLVRQTSWRP